ncbi:MAG: hypothetical protein EHM21_01070 [Chloroflexi bacterium]|nr:MAG: hypothetical protein EHM21_01070 [Chloroflexota bacterium]
MTGDPNWLTRWDYSRPWFHGSPYLIETLLPGSTITQDRELARIFSHKPQIVSIEDDPAVLARGVPRLRHTGTLAGLLYFIDEPLSLQDVFPHPNSSMLPGLEWLTRRPLCLRLLGPVEINLAEVLSPEEIDGIMKRMKGME